MPFADYLQPADDFSFNFQISSRVFCISIPWNCLNFSFPCDYRFHFHFRRNLTAFQRKSCVKSIRIWWKISRARTNRWVGRRRLTALMDFWKIIFKSTMPLWVSTPLPQDVKSFSFHFSFSFFRPKQLYIGAVQILSIVYLAPKRRYLICVNFWMEHTRM